MVRSTGPDSTTDGPDEPAPAAPSPFDDLTEGDADAAQLPAWPFDVPVPAWRRGLDSVLDATGVSARTVVAVVVLVGAVAGGAWWSLREPAVPVEDTLPQVVVSSSSTAPPVVDDVVVHVAGAVARPGVLRLPGDARVIDAVDAAGGPAPDADLDRINLAAGLVDGMQLFVPRIGEPAPTAAGAVGGDGGVVNLNTATVADLEALPGVGPATAAAIIDQRDRIGGFTSVDQLLDVRGIGDAKFAALRDLVVV